MGALILVFFINIRGCKRNLTEITTFRQKHFSLQIACVALDCK